MVNIPTPEWIKELLGETPKGEPRTPHVSVPEPETEPMPDPMPAEEYEADLAADEAEVAADVHGGSESSVETDIPADIQDEIRELAAQEAEILEELEAGQPAEGPEAAVEAEADEPEPQEPPMPPRSPRRFEFRVEAARLKAFVAHLEHLVDEAKVTANENGWYVVAVDPAHVAMVDLHLADLADSFERRDGIPERIEGDIDFGIDLTKLKEILRLARKDDVVRVILDLPDAEDKDRITVEIGRTTRTMPALDTADMANPRVPALDLPAKLTVAANDLLEALKAAESVSDYVRLTATADGLNICAEGDVDKVSMDFRHGEQCDVEYVRGDEGKATSLFPLDYVSAFVKAAKAGPLIVQLGTDYPIRVDWDGATKGMWLLAPRIETNE